MMNLQHILALMGLSSKDLFEIILEIKVKLNIDTRLLEISNSSRMLIK